MVEDSALKRGAGFREPGEDGGGRPGEGGFKGLEEGLGLRSVGALVEQVDGASAAEAEGDVGGVVKEGGVALDGGSVAGEPEGFAGDLGFEAASADGSGVRSGGAEEKTGTRAAIA